jgi:hypothetical protein
VLVASRVTKYLIHVLVPSNWVYDVALNVFVTDISRLQGFVHSNIYEVWVRQYASTLETRLRYTLTDCFETFPFPQIISGLETLGETYHETRRQIMLARQEGLTKTYNRFHDSGEHASDIQQLRELHVQMDNAVAAAYGWQDLALGHDFHETAQGVRYTISESARREVLARLLKLNHERYEEEQLSGVGEGKKKGGGTRMNAEKRGESQKPGKKIGEDGGQYGLF